MFLYPPFLFLFHYIDQLSDLTLVGIFIGLYREKLFITKFVVDIFTDLLSVIPKRKTQGEGREKGVVYDTQLRLAIHDN